MIATLWVLAAWVPLVQDPSSIHDLVSRLGHEDIEQRVLAMQGLIRLSEAAIPHLKIALASDDPEVVHRAQLALSRIERLVELRPVYRERIPFSLDLQGVPMDKAAETIAVRSGVSFHMNPQLSRRLVTLTMTEGTLLEAMDHLCRLLRDTQWYYSAPDVISFRSQPFVPKPASYVDCFRISLRKIDTHRASDFAEGTGSAVLFLEARVEEGVQFLGVPIFSITEVVDEMNHAMTEWLQSPAVLDLRCGERDLTHPEPLATESRPFWFSGMGAFARRLRLVRGTATFAFSTGSEEVVLDALPMNEPREMGDRTIRILENDGGVLRLGLSRNDHPVDLTYFQTESVVVVDQEGESHQLTLKDCDCYQDPENHCSVLNFYFDRTGKTLAMRASFLLIRGVHEMRIPFEFRDVPLP